MLLCSACDDSSSSYASARWVEPIDDGLAQKLAPYESLPRPEINVLLISLDSVRRDYLSCYGHRPRRAPDEKTSPHVDRIAEEGVVLEQFYSNTSWTLPAHMSMMTGQPDIAHAVDYDPFGLHVERPTLAAVLQKLGYATAGYFSGTYLHPRFGFGRGFDDYRAAYGPELAAAHDEVQGLRAQADAAFDADDRATNDEIRAGFGPMELRLSNLSHKDRSSEYVTDAALGAIARAEQEGRPWFVFAHYFDPHYDYDPPEEYAERFDPSYDGDLDGKRFFLNPRIGTVRKDDPSRSLRDRKCTDRELDHILALYEAEIAWTDAQVGQDLRGSPSAWALWTRPS